MFWVFHWIDFGEQYWIGLKIHPPEMSSTKIKSEWGWVVPAWWEPLWIELTTPCHWINLSRQLFPIYILSNLSLWPQQNLIKIVFIGRKNFNEWRSIVPTFCFFSQIYEVKQERLGY